jgi:hypothetical protein
MAGNFAYGQPEYNVRLDIPAAKAVFERWSTPVIFSGFEIGRSISVQPDGVTHFSPGEGNRRYLLLDPSRRAGILAVLALLAGQPPADR